MELLLNSMQGHSTILCLCKEAVELNIEKIIFNELMWKYESKEEW